jgi:hypothetical protein
VIKFRAVSDATRSCATYRRLIASTHAQLQQALDHREHEGAEGKQVFVIC